MRTSPVSTLVFRELAARDALLPSRDLTPRLLRPQMPVPRGRAARGHTEASSVQPALIAPGAEGVNPPPLGPSPSAPPSPKAPAALTTNFLGILDDNTAIPPDTMGAVGPNHVMTTLNTQVRVQTRAGATLSTVTLESFWQSTGATGVYDPKLAYDPYGNRWIFAAASDADSAAASLLIAASATSDPTGVWHLYRIDGDATNQVWLDYPSLGFNKTWVSISTNTFTNVTENFVGSNIYLIDKQSLYAGGPSLASTVISDSTIEDTLSPAETYDSSLATLYFLQMWDGSAGGNGTLRLYTVTGPVGAEVLTPVTFIPTPNPWDSAAPVINFAPQQGANQKIAVNDDRLFNTVYRNGTLWTNHTVFLPFGGSPNRSSVQWWQVSTAGAILQRGRIDDPSGATFYGFSSIGVNKNDDMLLGYSRFSATSFASAFFSFRSATDPVNTVQADTVLKSGLATYFKTFGGQENRWGDYSHTMVDPVDDTAFWTVQEYAAAHAGGGLAGSRWGTWWGQIVPPVSCGVDGAACNDGNPCTQSDTCLNGLCTSGPPVVCSALDACHVAGVCDPMNGGCSNPTQPDGTACNDGNACTQSDTCVAGACTGASPVGCPPAVDACHLAGACVPATGVCSAPTNQPNGTACSDGDACTSGEVCQAGTCGGGAPVVCPPADSCHLAGVCAPATGACAVGAPKADGTACNDGNACTQSDTCIAGVCTGSNPIACTAKDACHVAGVCSPATGVCTDPPQPGGTPCNDGNACTQSDTCQAGVCSGGAAVVCPPAVDACHVAGVCVPASGACSPPQNQPEGTACNDGNACTQGDSCKAGVCSAGVPVVCPAGDACHAAGVCDAATGACSTPPVPDGTSCNDGNACTQGDACKAGVCSAGVPVVCPAGDACHAAGVCDAATGACASAPLPDGTACNDGSACTQGDACKAGVCSAGVPVVCPAGDACHAAGVCDAATGACASAPLPDGTACNDGSACTKGDACKAGVCSAGVQIVCPAGDACHAAGVCDAASGTCTNAPLPDGTACSDGNACTQGDVCKAGSCAGGVPVTCPAPGPCHAPGVCDPATGACGNPTSPDGSPCDDGDACTHEDACGFGVCTGVQGVFCPASSECRDSEGCQPATGECILNDKPDGTPCPNGTCMFGMCTGSVTTSASSSSASSSSASSSGSSASGTGGSGTGAEEIGLYGRAGCYCDATGAGDADLRPGLGLIGLLLARLRRRPARASRAARARS